MVKAKNYVSPISMLVHFQLRASFLQLLWIFFTRLKINFKKIQGNTLFSLPIKINWLRTFPRCDWDSTSSICIKNEWSELCRWPIRGLENAPRTAYLLWKRWMDLWKTGWVIPLFQHVGDRYAYLLSEIKANIHFRIGPKLCPGTS